MRVGKEDKARRKRFPMKTTTEWGLDHGVYTVVTVQFALQWAQEMTAYLVNIIRMTRDNPGEM